jgi:hypothetical protein
MSKGLSLNSDTPQRVFRAGAPFLQLQLEEVAQVAEAHPRAKRVLVKPAGDAVSKLPQDLKERIDCSSERPLKRIEQSSMHSFFRL